MKPLDRLSDYLAAIERRLRVLALTRGAAVTAAVALVLTVIAVLIANHFAFSTSSVTGARLLLFLGLAFALAAGLIVPIIRLNRRRAARAAEQRYPQFEERLLTFTERMDANAADPFLPLLADDALSVARQAEPREVAKTAVMFSFSSAAIIGVLALMWMGNSGGFLGYGTALLWGGLPKGDMKPFYSIKVDPGNHTVRKRSDQMISATLLGFTADKVRFFGKYASASGWEQADMRTEAGGSAYEFLIAGIPESLEYYVEAGGIRSETYKLNVVDLPSVKRIRVTYHFPAWTGMKDAVEDPGGDLRAVEGTTAEVAIQTDKPLGSGAILLDDGTKLPLRNDAGMLVARVPIQKDGMYHVAAVEGGEDVRLTEDYFIEAQKYRAPEVSITRPGRDFRANPIEEVTVSVEAKDDFALKGVDLHYAVNGGAEKTVPLLKDPGAKTATGNAVLSLEDFKVQPGDIVSIYASAKDARSTTTTDMFFIQAEPFERNYSQSQQGGGGGGGGGGDDDQNQISDREKEIITATWNQIKGQGAKGTDSENAAFLASVQSKLRDQTKSLGERMKARQLEGAGDSFKSFVTDLDQAVNVMGPASDKLKGAKWQDALQPEQKALQYLLRAEATFRDIQVAFRQQGGGGGGGGMGGASRDLEGLFDLELDTEKNQYEGASQMQSADQRQKQLDDAMEKLKQLAKRQQELAEQQRRSPQTPQQRWEQEMLRREAEQLQRQLQQLAQNGQLSRGNSQQQSSQGQGQQSQGGQPGQSGQAGQQGQMSQQQGQQGQPGQQGQMSQQQRAQMNQAGNDRLRQANAQQLRETLDRLQQALQDMRNAAGSGPGGTPAGTPQAEAEARRAADRLNEAQQLMSGLRQAQASNQVDDLLRQADQLAQKQQDFEGQMRRAFGPNGDATRQKAEELAGQKDGELNDLKKLEQGMQGATRDLQSTQRPAATKMREALGAMQEQEIERDMQRNSEWLRRGLGGYAVLSEAQITAGLNQLRDQLRDVQKAMGAGGNNGKDAQADKAMEQALGHVEQLRRQMEQMAQAAQGQRGQQGGQRGQQGQQGGQQGRQGQQGQQAGNQGQQGQQGGQQAGSQGQQGQQAGGSQSGQPNRGSTGNQGGGGGNWNGTRWGGGDAAWNGTWNNGPVERHQFEQTYRDAMQSLGQLEQQLRNDPASARDIGGLMRDLRQFDPFAYSNDPLLAERIQAALAGVEQVEMELRRKVDQTNGDGSVRSPGSEPVPQGYQDAVADYFRRLSKSK